MKQKMEALVKKMEALAKFQEGLEILGHSATNEQTMKLGIIINKMIELDANFDDIRVSTYAQDLNM